MWPGMFHAERRVGSAMNEMKKRHASMCCWIILLCMPPKELGSFFFEMIDCGGDVFYAAARKTIFVYCLFAAAAFLIAAAPFVASASDSKPNMAEYFLPITWATTKSMLMPSSAMA